MPTVPKYIQDLIAQGKVHTEQLANLRKETDDLGKKADICKDASAEVRREIALINQKLEEQGNQIKKWNARWWYLIGGFVLGLLALVSSLLVALVKK